MQFFRRRRSHLKLEGAISRTRIEALEARRLLAADVWSGAGADALFSDGANWVGGVAPTSGQAVTFPAGAAQTAVTVNSAVTVGDVEFDASYTLNSANTITLDGNVAATAGTSIINNPVVLGLTPVVNTNINANVEFNNVVSDGGNGFGFNKQGIGILTLGGAGDTYTGTTAINDGLLVNLTSLDSSVVVLASAGSFNGTGSIPSFTGNGNSLVRIINGANAGSLTVADNLTFTGNGSNSVLFDIDGAGASSQITVTAGTIALDNAVLNTAIINGYVEPGGTVITLIQNNTGTAISGTFSGLPEGSNLTIGGHVYTISYVGGANNDNVTLTAALPPDVWTGAGANANFSTGANWQSGVAPVAGQDLLFPTGVTQTAVTVNSNITVGDVEFDASYTFTSSGGGAKTITLDGNVTATAGTIVINDPVILGLTPTINTNEPANVEFNAVSGRGFGFNKQGVGVLTLEGNGDTYTGVTAINAGLVVSTTTLTSIVDVASGASFDGTGSVASLVGSGGITRLINGAAAGQLSVGTNLTFAGDTVLFDIDGDNASSQITVGAGTISLGNAVLNTAVIGGFIATGSTSITLIQNNTGGAISGTFAGLPEGSKITIGNEVYTLSYVGGANKDNCTLTATQAAAFITLTANRSAAYEGHTVVLTATVTGNDSNADPVTGTVTFYENFVPIELGNQGGFGGGGGGFGGGGGGQTATDEPLVKGKVSINVTSLPVGADTITAVYNGDVNFAAAQTTNSKPLVVNIRQGTVPQIDPSATTTEASTRGLTISATVTATDTAPAGTEGLTYSWTTIHAPSGGKNAVFNMNNSNAASTIIARFSKDGGYVLRCTVTNQAGNTAFTDVAVTVTQKATTMRIEPHKAQIHAHRTQQYVATVLDQFGRPMRTPPTLTYLVTAGRASGSINSSTGLFTATAVAGNVLIEVEDGTLTGTVGATVL